MKLVIASTIFLVLSCSSPASAWDNDDLEIFDLVELVNKNFYELMGISQVRGIYVTWIQKLATSESNQDE
jgi:hypothetical protein